MVTILLVDDDSDLRPLIARGLERAGYRVVPVENGDLALRCLRESKERVDLVITDLYMPERDGIEVVMDCKKRGIRVIAMSGGLPQTKLDMLPVAKTLGAVEQIDKPFLIEELVKKVKAILGPE